MYKDEVKKISELILNDTNPRTIRDDKFKLLIKSLQDDPGMIEAKPIIIDENNRILGGNMRARALKSLGIKDVLCRIVYDWTEEEKRRFVIKDNTHYGEWDYDILANEWDSEQLHAYGVEMPQLQEDKDDEGAYTKTIQTPIYEIKGEKPSIKDLYDTKKYIELCEEIEKTDIGEEEKQFLRVAALRHIVFNYKNMAEYYAHTNATIQNLMEKSALVIIDYEKAIEYGYVQLSKEIASQYGQDYDE